MSTHIGGRIGNFVSGGHSVDLAFASKLVINTGLAAGSGILAILITEGSNISKPQIVGGVALGLLACKFTAHAVGSAQAWIEPESTNVKTYSALSNQKANERIRDVAKLTLGSVGLYGFYNLATSPALGRLLI